MSDIQPKGAVSYDATCVPALNLRASMALQGVTDMIIDSVTMYEIAADELKAIKMLQKDVEDQRTAITVPLNTALRGVNDLFRAPKEYLEKAERLIKSAIAKWQTEQERLALAAQREAEEAAQKERERLAVIQREKEQEQRRAEEASRKAHEEAQRLAAEGNEAAAAAARQEAQAQAEVAEAAHADVAEAALTSEVVSFAPAVSAPAKVSGISGQMRYSAEVTDLKALIEAVAAGKAPIQCLCADDKFLGAQARAFKSPGELYPGVRVKVERSISARAA